MLPDNPRSQPRGNYNPFLPRRQGQDTAVGARGQGGAPGSAAVAPLGAVAQAKRAREDQEKSEQQALVRKAEQADGKEAGAGPLAKKPCSPSAASAPGAAATQKPPHAQPLLLPKPSTQSAGAAQAADLGSKGSGGPAGTQQHYVEITGSGAGARADSPHAGPAAAEGAAGQGAAAQGAGEGVGGGAKKGHGAGAAAPVTKTLPPRSAALQATLATKKVLEAEANGLVSAARSVSISVLAAAACP